MSLTKYFLFEIIVNNITKYIDIENFANYEK